MLLLVLASFRQEALQWLEGYMPEDLCIAQLKGSSNSLWTISPPSRNSLIEMLGSEDEFLITVSWSVQRCTMTKLLSNSVTISDGCNSTEMY